MESLSPQVADHEHVHASLTWSGLYWIVAFETRRFFSDDPHEVRLVQLDRGTRLSVGQAIPGTFVANGFAPKLVTAGSRTWLAWREDSSDGALRLLALTPDGDPDLSQQQRIAAAFPLDPRFGAAAKGSQVVLAYPRYAGDDAGHVPRIYATITGATVGKRRAVR